MDRQIVYAGAIPRDVDLLSQNKNVLIGLGYLMQAILGVSTFVDGLACTPTGPATLTVNVGNGSIYSLQNVDGTAYGSLSADTTDQIVKQGIIMSTTNFPTPAPVTTGQSVVYLIEAAYQDSDTGSVVLPYYNSSNPAVAYNGPANSGVSQNTVRQGVCQLQIKTGTPATTGSQTTPAPDAGYVGLYAITVANGASSVTSGNIVQLTTAPFISPKLGSISASIQQNAQNYAADTSGAANTITVALNPALSSLVAGQKIWVKIANTNTTAAAPVMNVNALGNVAINDNSGNPAPAGSLLANRIYGFIYDGSAWELQSQQSNAVSVGQCLFKYTSATVCTLIPKNGNKVSFPSGAIASIPSAGIASTYNSAVVNGVAAQTLAASTLLYAYLWNNGTSYVIDWSATAYAVDATTGIVIKSGDATRVLVGMAYTNGSSQFVSSASANQVRSWFNERVAFTSNGFTTSRTTSSTSLVEVHTEIRNSILTWAGETLKANLAGFAFNGTSAQGAGTGIGLDSTSAISGATSEGVSAASGQNFPYASNYITNSLSEGLHFATLLGESQSSGTTTYTQNAYLSCETSR